MIDIQGPAARVRGPVFTPGDDGYDDERIGFQLAGPHRPALIVGAEDADDVRAAVEFAAANGLPIAVQATGHGLPLPTDGGLLISTRRMNGLRVDPAARTASIEAGVRWEQVVAEAARHGLAPLNGSAPSVGAVSYTLGGGVGLMARRYGFAADHVRAIDVVTADAGLRHVTAESDPELFWALRGGRANFGVVTRLEIDLMPVSRLYGGGLYFDGDLVPEVLDTYRQWTAAVPDEMTSSVALIPFPDVPAVPEPLRGRHIAHVRIIHAGDAATGERLVAPLRAVGSRLIDTVADMPYAACGSIHNEPATPMAYHASHTLLYGLDADAVQKALDLVGPGGPEPCVMEIRHLGGALAKPPAVPNAVGNRDAEFIAGFLAKAGPDTDMDSVRSLHRRLLEPFAPRAAGRCLNFLYGENAGADHVRAAYDPDTYRRLADLKAVHDPNDVFRLNHHIPPADR
jgi:hypothetical protein